jgi:hypothetical protein
LLVYLDSAQLSWIEQLPGDKRDEFITKWRELGCELALSLQLLQEVHKRGADERVRTRAKAISELSPLRGIPAGSAGVMVREIIAQVRRIVGSSDSDVLADGRRALFPIMSRRTLFETLDIQTPQFSRFNMIGDAQARLQTNARSLPPIKKDTRVDPIVMENFIRSKQKELLTALPPSIAADLARELGERAIDSVKAANGNLWQANLARLGISNIRCLSDLQYEDYSKAAGFIEMATEFAEDIGKGAGINKSEVLKLVNELNPYDAPGYSLEMAVARARARHSHNPTASDQVDEEHVTFAPYVDIMFVDKRTQAYLTEEVRRQDGRIAFDPMSKVVRARDVEDVLAKIEAAKASG